uniref:ADP-ribosylation factor n=1 Tax=Peronospora matthiolae TaxID=2874970 RepID=A0AAV1TJJ2_9STRA
MPIDHDIVQAQAGRSGTTIPTIGFNIVTARYKNISCKAQGFGGQDKIRPLWRHYYKNTQRLIFEVDIYDGDRVDAVEGELLRLLNE